MTDNDVSKIKTKTVILSVIITVTLAFIWGNSLIGKSASSKESRGVYSWVLPLLDWLFGKGVITHAIFRKIAHAIEYYVLGTEIFIMFGIYDRANIKNVFYSLIGMFVAVVDETLQIFSGRGASVVDVWVDFSGYIFATVLSFLICLLIKTIANKRKKEL